MSRAYLQGWRRAADIRTFVLYLHTVRPNQGVRDMLNTLQLLRARRRQRREARAAFADGVGATAKRWPLAYDRAALTDEADAWLRQRIARTATPYGITGCSILVRVSRDGNTVTWPYRSAGFVRNAPTDAITHAVAALAQLEPEQYPDATHVEVHLLSLGDVTRHGLREL